MGRWLDLAREQGASERGEDTRDDRVTRAPSVPSVPTVPALPASVLMGLNRLAAMPLPRGMPAAPWREVVADALRLRDEGWAEQALAMGWLPAQLFGVSPDFYFEGVAVELRGRSVLALLDDNTAALPGARACLVVKNDCGLGYINRRAAPADVLMLWEL